MIFMFYWIQSNLKSFHPTPPYQFDKSRTDQLGAFFYVFHVLVYFFNCHYNKLKILTKHIKRNNTEIIYM